jgi:hypothetical protein
MNSSRWANQFAPIPQRFAPTAADKSMRFDRLLLASRKRAAPDKNNPTESIAKGHDCAGTFNLPAQKR